MPFSSWVLGVVLLFFPLGGLFCLLSRPGCWASCCLFFSLSGLFSLTFSSWVLGVVLLFFSSPGFFGCLFRPGCWASCCSFFLSAGFFAYFCVLGAGRRAAFFFSLGGLCSLTFASRVLGVVLLFFFSRRAFFTYFFVLGAGRRAAFFFLSGLSWRERATVGIVVGKHETLAFFSEKKW